ncbi:MAG: hypothetical protein J0L97_04580 [Alphaproteobacteria bacterium]|nr:hypothetical protein [Alphaproteobacteria bacterium]
MYAYENLPENGLYVDWQQRLALKLPGAEPETAKYMLVSGSPLPPGFGTPSYIKPIYYWDGSNNSDYMEAKLAKHIFGNRGDDVINLTNPGAAETYVFGGGGADTFIMGPARTGFFNSSPLVVIRDFFPDFWVPDGSWEQRPATFVPGDRIDLSAYVPDFNSLKITYSDYGQSATLSYGEHTWHVEGSRLNFSESNVLTAASQKTASLNSDLLHGGVFGDSMSGLEGVDVIHGYEGNDILHGNEGNDFLSSDAGSDELYGGQGDDLMYGGDGDDLLHGNLGDDHLHSDLGNDILYGGLGTDRFYFTSQHGHDRILDFELGTDKLVFSGLGPRNGGVAFHASYVEDGNLVIQSNLGNITLVGVQSIGIHDLEFI